MINLTCKVVTAAKRVIIYVEHGERFNIEDHLTKINWPGVNKKDLNIVQNAAKRLKPGEWLEVEAVAAP